MVDCGIDVLVAAVVVGGIAVAAAVAGVVAGAVNAGTQYLATGEVDWSQVVIATSIGAVSGAVAATPLGVGGQVLVNGVLGGGQSILTGGGKVDVLEGIVTGAFCGWLGGAGFVNGWPKSNEINRNIVWSLFHPYKTLTREGIKAIKSGVIKSGVFNFIYGLGDSYTTEKLEELYECITE